MKNSRQKRGTNLKHDYSGSRFSHIQNAGIQKFICASTDGLENVCMNLRTWLPFAPFFQPLETYLEQTNNPEEDKQYLIQFLESERLQSRTDDDKTLLLCLSEFS